TLGHDVAYAMTWETLKKKMTDKYCPRGEIKKPEIKLWNLKVKGNDIGSYTQFFQELALICTKFVSDEKEKFHKYIGGLLDNIHGNVMQTESKRKFDNDNQAQQLPKRQNVAQAYAVGTGERKEYDGTLPVCNKCKFHHNGARTTKTLGHDVAYAMTWETLKKKMTDKYCPRGEIKKPEIKLWNLKVKGNDIGSYTQFFQELALICTKFVSDEKEKFHKYIGGLLDNIHGNVMSARPKTLDKAIELANDLMD
nr:reverse transcriptase domain-containing protein [Tanacetum cinerariifolium]